MTDVHSLLQRVALRTRDWHFHCWYWGDAIAIDGLLEAQIAAPGGQYRAHVLEVLDRWHRHCEPNFDDALAPAAALIQCVLAGDLPAAAAERFLARLNSLPRAYGAVPALEPHRPFFRFGLCIDAIYHLPAAYAWAARWRGDASLEAMAIRIAVDGMRSLRCRSGWAQWYDPTRRRNNEVAWSRGLGWAALGLLDLLLLIEGRGSAEIEDLAGAVLERLAHTQGPAGNWAAVLDHAPAETETSTAAFYVAAALHPAARRLAALPPGVLERATEAVLRAIDATGTVTGVTADVLPSWDIKTYERCPTEPSPWAQGAGLRALSALARQSKLSETRSTPGPGVTS